LGLVGVHRYLMFIRRLKFQVAFLLFLNLLAPSSVLAAVEVKESGDFAQLSQLTVVFANAVSVIATLAGFAVLIMLIRGGVAYITAQGDPKALTTARSTITWALIGLVIILAAFLVISLIVGFVNLPGVGKFCLPTAGQDALNACPGLN